GAWQAAVGLVSLFNWHGRVGVAMENQYRTSDFFCCIGNIDLFQVMQQRHVETLSVVHGESLIAPLLKLVRRQDALGKLFRMNGRGDRYEGSHGWLLRGEK